MSEEQRVRMAKEKLIAEIDAMKANGNFTPEALITFLCKLVIAGRLANEDISAALILCNESRNRLTPFESSPKFWIKEARGEMEARQ